MRLSNVDLSDKPEAKAALLRHLESHQGTDKYLEIVEKFQLAETKDELLRLALENSESTLGVEATRLLVKFGASDLLTKTLADKDDSQGGEAGECPPPARRAADERTAGATRRR